MRKRHLIGFIVLSTSLAWAQTLDGAKVTGLSGVVQVRVDKIWKALKLGEQVAQDALIHLGEGAQLSLRYRSDGHREEARGPGELKIGHAAGNSIVTSYGFRNRPLELPRSGGLDAVGGSIANASGSGSPSFALRGPARPTAAAPGAIPVPASDRAMAPTMPPPPQIVPEPQLPTLDLAWQDRSVPSLMSSLPSDQLQIGGFEGEAVVLEEDQEIARIPVKGNQPVDFSTLNLREDTLYLVKLVVGESTQGTMSFRLLNEEERGELLQLARQTEVTMEQHQQRLDRFIDLGQYHLAAQECKRWLEEQKQPSPYLLQLVYDLNRDVLHDSRQTQYWADWAAAHQLTLEP